MHSKLHLPMCFTVPGPVSDLSAKSEFTMVQLTISWSPPIEPNGVIIAYEIGSNSSGVFTYSNTTDTQDILRDFTPNTVVVFSVRAYTIIGPGENVTDQSLTTIIRKNSTLIQQCYQYFFTDSSCCWSKRCFSEQHSSDCFLDSCQFSNSEPLQYTLHGN